MKTDKIIHGIVNDPGTIIPDTNTFNTTTTRGPKSDSPALASDVTQPLQQLLSNDARLKELTDTNTAKAGLPVGGATGQVLGKKSSANFDTEWLDKASSADNAARNEIKEVKGTAKFDDATPIDLTVAKAAITLNTVKVGITTNQTRDITVNNTKTSVPNGGGAGQILAKKSNADKDIMWIDPAGATADYNAREEIKGIKGTANYDDDPAITLIQTNLELSDIRSLYAKTDDIPGIINTNVTVKANSDHRKNTTGDVHGATGAFVVNAIVRRDSDGDICIGRVISNVDMPVTGVSADGKTKGLYFSSAVSSSPLYIYSETSSWNTKASEVACAGTGDGKNRTKDLIPVTVGDGRFSWIAIAKINGLRVGDLIWNDTTLKAMGSNMMPATGIHYLDPVIFPELFEKVGYSKGRKDDLFEVGIDTDYPYLSMVRTGRGIGNKEKDALQGHMHTYTTNSNFALFGSDVPKKTVQAPGGGDYSFQIKTTQISNYVNNGHGDPRIGTTTHPANTACYLNRVASTSQNEALEQALKDTPLLTVRCIATKDNLEGFAEHELMGEMEVPFNYHTTKFHYDEDDKLIVDKVEYWVSESQTKLESLETKKGFTQLFKNDKFEYIEDHRKEVVFDKLTGQSITVDYLGKIKETQTTIKPPISVEYYKFKTNKWVLNEDSHIVLKDAVSKKAYSQTSNNISKVVMLREGSEMEFDTNVPHMQFTSNSQYWDFHDTLDSKTMEELIALLIMNTIKL